MVFQGGGLLNRGEFNWMLCICNSLSISLSSISLSCSYCIYLSDYLSICIYFMKMENSNLLPIIEIYVLWYDVFSIVFSNEWFKLKLKWLLSTRKTYWVCRLGTLTNNRVYRLSTITTTECAISDNNIHLSVTFQYYNNLLSVPS